MITLRWPHIGIGLLAAAGMLLAGCKNNSSSGQPPPMTPAPIPSAPAVTGDPALGRPVFNDPLSNESSARAAVLLQLARLIKDVPGGGTIELAIHQFDVQDAIVETQIVRELVDRAHHGVRVRVLMDGGNLTSKNGQPSLALRMLHGGFQGTSSWVATCRDRMPDTVRGCIASKLNHNKFALFSTVRTGGGQRYSNVVFQSSSNIADFYTTSSWNDAFTVSDAKLYAGYRAYFNDLVAARDHDTLEPYGEYWPTPYTREVDGTSAKYHAFMYPRAGADDPIVHELDGVSCHRPPTGPPGGGGALINLAMMSFTKARQALADKLAQKAADGCAVTILYYPGANNNDKFAEPAWDPAIVKQLSNAGAILFPCRSKKNEPQIVLHTKIMTIEGYIDGTRTLETYTGSANFTNLTRSDDAWLRIVDDRTEIAYRKWMFQDVGSHYCQPT